MRGAAFVVVGCLLGSPLLGHATDTAGPAAAGSAAPVAVAPAPVDPAVATEVEQALAAIVAAPSADARAALVHTLAERGASIVPALAGYLARTHATTEDARRAVLQQIKASTPDKTGKFETPGRKLEAQVRADDEFDWLAELAGQDARKPEVAETIADVAALRVLAETRDVAAATVIFDVGFAPATMIYRDECGRRLRAMQPYSVPALTRASKADGKKVTDRKRYATYQLERIDRQDADKALTAAATDEALQIAILEAFRDVRHREAVYAVFARIDADAPRVRAAAREAWLAYVTGPPPPLARTLHLALPGGRFATKATPVELTYRQLAEQELRGAAAELFKEIVAEGDPLDVEAMSRRVFAYHDAERATREQAELAAGKQQATAGDLVAACAVFDRLLAANPDRADRAEMAPTYLALATQLEGQAQWPAAAAAYSKAHGVDPAGAGAVHALARHHFALGKALAADGKDGSAEFRRAAALEPSDPEVKRAAEPAGTTSPWLLYAGVGVGALALVLFGFGLMLRRRAPAR